MIKWVGTLTCMSPENLNEVEYDSFGVFLYAYKCYRFPNPL